MRYYFLHGWLLKTMDICKILLKRKKQPSSSSPLLDFLEGKKICTVQTESELFQDLCLRHHKHKEHIRWLSRDIGLLSLTDQGESPVSVARGVVTRLQADKKQGYVGTAKGRAFRGRNHLAGCHVHSVSRSQEILTAASLSACGPGPYTIPQIIILLRKHYGSKQLWKHLRPEKYLLECSVSKWLLNYFRKLWKTMFLPHKPPPSPKNLLRWICRSSHPIGFLKTLSPISYLGLYF